MADQKNRGGQKLGNLDPQHPEQHQHVHAGETGERADKDKQQDQRNNPDDDRREATDRDQKR